ncbi:dipeptide/oligopeptide/nickel ABC transporter permease/ATP-binding protein [Brevibacterium aurantiacum]|uniref:dipeptide/oligopeptide/nickel ABC transporter permease/ATP-binding protein n=1 Tax=Brevibacterium aurantiacum TaxID=273384 RepID=UPI001867EEDE|nr:dipeptide/oligopeptide/nickel ABC transporter permease/ATP-binding protein [Brevibacterium aurantiacum]
MSLLNASADNEASDIVLPPPAGTVNRADVNRLRRAGWATPAGIAAIFGTAVLALLVIFGESVWGESAVERSMGERMQASSGEHLFGTDELGRDILARVMIATRLSLTLTIGATGIAVAGGITIGLVAAVLPKHPRRSLVWLMDMLLAFPWLLMVLFFTVIWGATATGSMFAIGLAGIPNVTRLVYTMSSSVAGQDFVKAAKVVGVGNFGVLRRHILPNITNALLVQASAVASVTLLSFAALSFLGLGVQAPEYDWGRLLADGIARIYINPMAAIGPGITIIFAGLVFTLISEAMSGSNGRGGRLVSSPRSSVRLKNGQQVGRARHDVSERLSNGGPDAGSRQPRKEAPRPIAEVGGLHISFPNENGELIERVHDMNFHVLPGETVGIVGESGSGKSLTAMALAGLLDNPAVVDAQLQMFDDIDLTSPLSQQEVTRLGTEMGMVFQDPLTSLNPALTIGRQLTEVPQTHLQMRRSEARSRATESLKAVGIPDASERLKEYPYQLSGGMRQRAMIGMALTGRTRLIVADEPTTALDVTVQRQVLTVLQRAQQATNAAIIFISHDIALVSSFCDRVVVMKDGRIVEQLNAARIRDEATHPYTRGLIACLPTMQSDRTRPLPVIGDSAAAIEFGIGEPSTGATPSRPSDLTDIQEEELQ